MSNDQRPDDPWTSGPAVPRQQPGWAEQQIERVLQASLIEQRRSRRWGIVFKTLFLLYLVALPVLLFYDDWRPGADDNGDAQHTALVDLKGVIAAGSDADADTIVSGLRAAFKDPDTRAVILRINSPGGSPVQSRYIYDEMIRLRAKHRGIPLYAVISDVGASGGYYVAAGADRIYADSASIIGSIGVRMDGFGLDKLIDKLGIERRLLTAGESKGLLDPFLPSDPEQVRHVQGLLDGIHRQFIDSVRQGRGARLADDPRLFSGLIWTGEQGVELGLVDALGNSGFVAREVVGVEKIVNFTPRRQFWERLVDRFGVSLAAGLVSGFALPPLR